jgi:hypothetical protein
LEEITMLNKRITSLALAALTTAALAAPAFAANQTVVTTTYAEIPISVTVPTTGTAQINPYGLPVEVKKTTSGATAAKISGHQITTQPLYITNNGDTDLSIGATVTTAVKSGSTMEIVATAPGSTETSKQAQVYLEVMASKQTSAAATLTSEEKDKLIDEAAAWKEVAYSKDSPAATQLLLSTDDAVTKSGMVTIKGMKETSTTEGSGDTAKTVTVRTYQEGSIVQFRLDGKVTESPDEAWTTKDGFTATIAFTFKPAAASTGASA